MKGNIKSLTKGKFLALTLSFMLVMATAVFAAEPVAFDAATALGTAANDLKSQMFGILAVVVPVVVTITGAVIGLKKGLGVFKSLTSK